MTISWLHEGYLNKKFTITEVVKAYLERINEIDMAGPELNSVIMMNPDALIIAGGLDRELQ